MRTGMKMLVRIRKGTEKCNIKIVYSHLGGLTKLLFKFASKRSAPRLREKPYRAQ